MSGNFLERLEKAGFALFGAGRTDRVTQQDDVAFAAQQLAHVFAGQHAAFVIVRRDEADVVAPIFRPESMMTTGTLASMALCDRPDQCLGIQRRQDDAADAPRGEILPLSGFAGRGRLRAAGPSK